MKIVSRSEVGKVRTQNEDNTATYTNESGSILSIVCDGMGGHRAGEVASHIVVQYLGEAFKDAAPVMNQQEAIDWLTMAINKAHQCVLSLSHDDERKKGMGTTIVAALIMTNFIIIANVGDSRAYVYEEGTLFQVTEDQTLVNELVKTGAITAEEALVHPQRHVVMSAIGGVEQLCVDTIKVSKVTSTLMLCSDGLSNMVPYDELTSVLKQTASLEEKIETLISRANVYGGEDNITVVLIEIEEEDIDG